LDRKGTKIPRKSEKKTTIKTRKKQVRLIIKRMIIKKKIRGEL